MVFAMALALAGLNPEEFSGLIAKLTPEHKLRGGAERPASPSSRSESSGIGTLAPSLRSSEGSSPWPTPFSSRTPSVRSADGNTPSLTPISSRPSTPTDEILKNQTEQTVTSLLDVSKKRDLLNLGANVKDPRWQIVHPSMPLHDFQSYLTNQSVYHRLGDRGLSEDYPMRFCEDCDFAQPSPYLFGELYVKKSSSGGATTR